MWIVNSSGVNEEFYWNCLGKVYISTDKDTYNIESRSLKLYRKFYMIRIININFYNTVLYWSLVFWIQDHLEQLLLGVELIIINEVVSLFLGDTVNMRHFVPELDSVEFVGVFQQLRSVMDEKMDIYFSRQMEIFSPDLHKYFL